MSTNKESEGSREQESEDCQSSRETQLAQSLQRDLRRHQRRKGSQKSFWRWVGVLGMVGWPLAISTVGGAWLGHYVDKKMDTGIQFTLMFLTIGLTLGVLVVWNVLKETEKE